MKKLSALWIVFLVLILWSLPQFSYADWWGNHAGHHGEHRFYHYHDHLRFGFHVSSFYPGEYYQIWVGGRRYYYDDGVYYYYLNGDYVVAAPPMGAVVSSIPSDFQPVTINGMTYYTNNGSYYLYTPNGYEAVSPPTVQAVPVAASTQATVTVNVPNNSGGYVTVTLKRSGNGFVGPQGEFYSDFPKVTQLQTMYGR